MSRASLPGAPDPGLCGVCLNVRIVETARGSRFYLCRLSETDARFPRYPPLPVHRCRGHVPDPAPAAAEPPREP